MDGRWHDLLEAGGRESARLWLCWAWLPEVAGARLGGLVAPVGKPSLSSKEDVFVDVVNKIAFPLSADTGTLLSKRQQPCRQPSSSTAWRFSSSPCRCFPLARLARGGSQAAQVIVPVVGARIAINAAGLGMDAVLPMLNSASAMYNGSLPCSAHVQALPGGRAGGCG